MPDEVLAHRLKIRATLSSLLSRLPSISTVELVYDLKIG